MDINRLKYLLALGKTENMRQAAEIIGITPPALSKAVKLLEQELECQLIIHQGRGLLLTDQAKALLPQVQRVMDEVNLLTATKKNDPKNTLRFGSFEVFSTYFLAKVLSSEFQGHKIELHEATPGELEEQIHQNQIDIGITYIPIPHPEIDHLKIGRIKMGLFHNQQKFTKMHFKDIPFVIPLPSRGELPSKIKGLDGWPEGSIKRNVVFKVMMMESALALCREGAAMAYLPEFVVDLHNATIQAKYSLKQYPFSKRTLSKCIHQDVFLVKRKTTVEASAHKKVARALRKIMAYNSDLLRIKSQRMNPKKQSILIKSS